MHPASGPYNSPAATSVAEKRLASIAVATRREGGLIEPQIAAGSPFAQLRVASARMGGLALALSAAALAAAAQHLFSQRAAFSWTALGLAALAVAAISLAFARRPLWWMRSAGPEERRRDTTALPLTRWRVGLLLAAGLLILLTLTALAGDRPDAPRPDLNWTLASWAMAVGCYLAATATPGGWLRRPRFTPAVLLAPLAIGALALLLRVWNIGAIPPTLSGDEGSQGLEAVRVLAGAIQNPFSTGWLGVPTMSFYFNAPGIALLGQNAAGLRLPWALVGAATVIAAYALVARLHGHTLALISAALLAGYHYHIHFSRLGSNQIADGLFATLALLCLYRGYDRRSPFDYALCGAVVGAAQYFYAGARFAGILIAAVVVVLALRDGRRFWREQGRGVAVLAGAALLSAAPMIQYALRFPDAYNARLNAVGIIQSGWLEREQVILNQGALPILVDQFWRAALAYNAYPDRTVWYGSPRPLFDLAHGALFILGLGFALTRLLDRRIFPLVAWWGGAIVLGGMLTESPPSSQRLVTTAIPAIIFVALGLTLLVQGLGQALGALHPRRLAPVLGVATAVLAALSVRYYFVEYTPTRVYGNLNAVLATELAHYANNRLAPDSRLVFFGWPRMSSDFGTLPYLAPHLERVDVHDPLEEPVSPALAARDRQTVFVFVPERAGELDLVRFAFPNGAVEHVPSPVDGALLFSMYQLPGEEFLAKQ
ncbi:MAG: glycosyltransferase family 39 protein [Oscillochloridaceae bacterium]|nr:glycosyltransferase family 39 protein [Chloroflexaceae bacterium]MDW8389799.1 glycosyltransferase family 39 protein [Oscillochloridaceae bacterium]